MHKASDRAETGTGAETGLEPKHEHSGVLNKTQDMKVTTDTSRWELQCMLRGWICDKLLVITHTCTQLTNG